MASRAFNGLLTGEPAQDLTAIRSALAQLPAEVQQKWAAAGQEQLAGGWPEELAKGGQFSPLQRKIVASGPRVHVFPTGIRAVTGTGRPDLTRQYEFGTLNREEKRTYTRRSRKGGSHSVTRRTKRQLPSRSQTGWIAYPAASRWGSRVFGMYLQLLVKLSHDALEAGDK